jgi:hypothetical protein
MLDTISLALVDTEGFAMRMTRPIEHARRDGTWLVLLVAVVLVAAACGDTADTTTEAPAATDAPASTEAPATTEAPADGPPAIPADHAGRSECLVCHAEGVGGAPKAPSEPDHSGFEDALDTCTACHEEAG